MGIDNGGGECGEKTKMTEMTAGEVMMEVMSGLTMTMTMIPAMGNDHDNESDNEDEMKKLINIIILAFSNLICVVHLSVIIFILNICFLKIAKNSFNLEYKCKT